MYPDDYVLSLSRVLFTTTITVNKQYDKTTHFALHPIQYAGLRYRIRLLRQLSTASN